MERIVGASVVNPTSLRPPARRAEPDRNTALDARSRCAVLAERILIGGGLGLSLLAWLHVFDCGACKSGWDLSGLGMVFYATMLLVHLAGPCGRASRWAAMIGIAAHAGLVYQMSESGQWCGICVATAAVAAALLAVRLARESWRDEWQDILGSLALILPAVNIGLLVAFAVVGVFGNVAMARASQEAQVTVFESPGCPHCRELDERTLKPLADRYGPWLAIKKEDASAFPVRVTPTIVVRGPKESLVLEGFRDLETLEHAMRKTGIALQQRQEQTGAGGRKP